MITLHVFNPEHEIAMARNIRNFTPTAIIQRFRREAGFIAAVWANDGDWILVDDSVEAEMSYRMLVPKTKKIHFVTPETLKKTSPDLFGIRTITPWGWDLAVATELRKYGWGSLVPADNTIADIRSMSHRAFASQHILSALTSMDSRLVGESRLSTSVPAYKGVPFVVKSPWSSSGRGVRMIVDESTFERNLSWMRGVVESQGSVMIEPLYEKTADFGLEFQRHNGKTAYCGLSLFYTRDGFYKGNIVATEEYKRERLADLVDIGLVDKVTEAICLLSDRFLCLYEGPFGVDLMVVQTENGGGRLHPCVELNLRRTMGHAALSLPCQTGRKQLLHITYSGRYIVSLTAL